MGQGTERKTVRVTILNQPYTLAATGEPGEIEALAQMVDDLMTNISARSANLDAQKLAVLACLHLADRLQSAEKELTSVKERVDHKVRQLSLLLEQTETGQTAPDQDAHTETRPAPTAIAMDQTAG